MAIARGNVANTISLTPGTTVDYTFDSGSTGADRYLVVCIYDQTSSTDKITGVTYNGSAMSLIIKRKNTNSQGLKYIYFYGIAAPSTGSNTIRISASATVNPWVLAAVYTGVSQTGQPDATASNARGNGSGDFSVSVTTVASDCWLILAESDDNGSIAATANCTKITTWGDSFGSQVFDSNGSVGGGGAHDITVTGQNGGGQDGLAFSLKPVSSTGPANMKTWDGLATASVKTIDGLALVNVKTWNGLT